MPNGVERALDSRKKRPSGYLVARQYGGNACKSLISLGSLFPVICITGNRGRVWCATPWRRCAVCCDACQLAGRRIGCTPYLGLIHLLIDKNDIKAQCYYFCEYSIDTIVIHNSERNWCILARFYGQITMIFIFYKRLQKTIHALLYAL